MLEKLQHKPILTIVIVVGLMLLINIDSLQVTIMEARNFITAREMVTDGNWLLTTMNGTPRYQKPPLPTWLTAVSSMVFGMKHLFGLRLPAILMVMTTGIYAYFLSFELLQNKKQALVNGLLTITSFYVIAIIIEAPWDIYAHGFMLVAIYHLFQLFQKINNYWKHTIIAGIFIGFSILSKAPVSVYALLLPFLIAYGIVFKYKHLKSKLFSFVSLLILALAIGGWWFLYVRYNDPQTFLAITSKETGNWSSYNVRPFYYYWSFFTQSGLWTIPAFISLLYPYLKSRVTNLKAYRLTFFWTIFAVILLSIIPEKKSRYLMPVLIPLALNTGFYVNYLIEKFKNLKDKREILPVYFNFGLIGLIGIAFPFLYFFLKDSLDSKYLVWFLIASIVLFFLGVAIILQLKRKHISNVFLLTIGFMVSVFLFVLPMTSALINSNYKPIIELQGNATKENLNVYVFNYVSPEMIWQYGAKIPQIKLNDSVYNYPKEKQFGLLTNDISPEDYELLSTKYLMEETQTFDLNTTKPESRKYRERLMNHYYILTKK